MNRIIKIIAFSLLLISCTKEENRTEPDQKILQSDYKLIRQWIFADYNPEMNPNMEFTLKSLTTTDIQNYLNARVYAIQTDVPGLASRSVFIKDSAVYDMGRYNLMGAMEPENFTVTDLDGDSCYELFYTITHGSGILRTNILCYLHDKGHLLLPVADSFMFPLDYSIELSLIDEQLMVFYRSGSTYMNIGEVKVFRSDNEIQCDFILKDNLPESVLNDISGK